MFTVSTSWLSSDAFLLSLLLLAFSILALKYLSFGSIENIRDAVALPGRSVANNGLLGPARAVQAYKQYANLAYSELTNMQRSHGKLGRAHRRIASELGYPQKLAQLGEVTKTNAQVTNAIAQAAREDLKLDAFWSVIGTTKTIPVPDSSDLGRVREALKHFVRDWSEEGKYEREIIYEPIMSILQTIPYAERGEMRVLVPGSGLGRLAYEISQLGYDTTGNEYSAYMNSAFKFLLNPIATKKIREHLVHPYAHWWSHQRSSDALFRAVRFPDVVPRLHERFRLAECDFLSLLPPPGPLAPSDGTTTEYEADRAAGYDFVVSLFFIDTSTNIIETLQQIHALLRPGGTWLNLGPLLWPSYAQARLELTLDEVLRLAEMVGFVLEEETRRTVRCEYTGDREGMMRWMYEAEFWTARKTK